LTLPRSGSRHAEAPPRHHRLTDQQKATAIDLYGGPVRTPQLGRLAADGILYEQAFTPHPLCVPARVSMWTGRYPHSHGARTNEIPMPRAETHRPLVQQPGNLEAAGDMALAATMAGVVLNSSSIHLVHAMGRPLSAWYGLHHGLVMGILLPSVLEFVAVGNEAAFARVARLLGITGSLPDDELARAGVERVRALQRAVGIPPTLSEVGVPPADLDRLADNVAGYPGPLDACPRPVTREDLGRLFGALLPAGGSVV
jgi:hypothetical protein